MIRGVVLSCELAKTCIEEAIRQIVANKITNSIDRFQMIWEVCIDSDLTRSDVVEAGYKISPLLGDALIRSNLSDLETFFKGGDISVNLDYTWGEIPPFSEFEKIWDQEIGDDEVYVLGRNMDLEEFYETLSDLVDVNPYSSSVSELLNTLNINWV